MPHYREKQNLKSSPKVIVIVPILSEGIVVEKTQYVSREKWRW